MSTSGDISSPIRNAWTYFSETYHNYSIPGPRDVDKISSHGFKGQGRKPHFRKMHFTGAGLPIYGLPSKKNLILIFLGDKYST